MRLGQTSFFTFGSQILASVLGFVATVVITQLMGSAVFGTYALIVAVVIWLKTIAVMGIRSAVVKRLSEEGDDGQYVVAGGLLLGGILAVLSLLLVLLSGQIDSYVGQQMTLPIIGLTWVSAALAFTSGILQGQHLVHWASLLQPLDIGVRSVVQISAVFAGLSLAGILFGYGAGAAVAALLGIFLFVSVRPRRPRRRHFTDLLTYARFSWLGQLSSRTFNSLDTVILGVFVSVGLIGIYEVAWNLASILAVFGTAIGQTLFPEISRLSSSEGLRDVRELLRQGLAYTGLLLVPGLVGAAIVGDLVLRVYGPEFSQGYLVLVLLVLSRLVYSYVEQLLTVLNGIDRPDLAFRVNGAFIAVNLGCNWILIWQFGWLGAAVATVTSAVVSLVVAYHYVGTIVDVVPVPYGELGRQVAAAGAMGTTILGIRTLVPDTLAVGIALVFVGALVYIVVLSGISLEFRTVIKDNIPLG